MKAKNEYRFKGRLCYLTINRDRRKTKKPGVTVVMDRASYPIVSRHLWRVLNSRRNHNYTATTQLPILLHRLINETPKGECCKFLDNNPANCRKSNLLNCDQYTVTLLHPKTKVTSSGEHHIYRTSTGYKVEMRYYGTTLYKRFRSLSKAIKYRDELVAMAKNTLKAQKRFEDASN